MKVKINFIKYLLFNTWLLLFTGCSIAKQPSILSTPVVPVNAAKTINIDPSVTYQTIDNFGASDAWSFQFLGKWPDSKKQTIANLLFSTDTTTSGQPEGIGLSLWRFNLGAGSSEQLNNSGINDEWRRSPAFINADKTYNWDNQAAQLWFLNAAQRRGVDQFLGFFNSPPVVFTKNGKAFSTDGKSNIAEDKYPDFTDYIAKTIKGVQEHFGITLNYISPVNEPQWDWKDGNQEGNPYTNLQLFRLVKSLDKTLVDQNLDTKIILPETGQIDYLLHSKDKADRGAQIDAFFNPNSISYVGNLSKVSKQVDGHSYFTTSPYAKAVALRQQLKAKLAAASIGYWMSEYSILGSNAGEIKGNGRDLGITPALYIAQVIHNDLVNANASAWQWWTAVSAYDYKDGLIYIDKNKTDGNIYQSKMLWALGNFSKFIRPGFQRVAVSSSALKDENSLLLVSAYGNKANKNIVVVVVNADAKAQTINFIIKGNSFKNFKSYVTSETSNLSPTNLTNTKDGIIIPARAIVTLVSRTGKIITK